MLQKYRLNLALVVRCEPIVTVVASVIRIESRVDVHGPVAHSNHPRGFTPIDRGEIVLHKHTLCAIQGVLCGHHQEMHGAEIKRIPGAIVRLTSRVPRHPELGLGRDAALTPGVLGPHAAAGPLPVPLMVAYGNHPGHPGGHGLDLGEELVPNTRVAQRVGQIPIVDHHLRAIHELLLQPPGRVQRRELPGGETPSKSALHTVVGIGLAQVSEGQDGNGALRGGPGLNRGLLGPPSVL
mmetsp:Transcript_26825/g.59273  ORF Transcript_26825/g.59273 Transcript_26825/m.59273 type:complete len:238 (+) Transcript_26825:405-1118(+)